jgi:hypothetical protein
MVGQILRKVRGSDFFPAFDCGKRRKPMEINQDGRSSTEVGIWDLSNTTKEY